MRPGKININIIFVVGSCAARTGRSYQHLFIMCGENFFNWKVKNVQFVFFLGNHFSVQLEENLWW